MNTTTLRLTLVACAVLPVMAISQPASATVLFSQGFETDNSGWFTPTRVGSGGGSLGVTSASGSFHAEAGGDFTRFGGYNYGAGNVGGVDFIEYKTSVDIFLDVSGNWANDTRFDFTSAISNISDGNHLRDFIFSGGFYNSADNDGPGGGSDRFVFSASNNSPGWPRNPARDPFAITTGGWYTFEHHFYDDGGALRVDMNILTSGGALANQWSLSNPGDLIASGGGVVGGSRYGWFPVNEFSALAIDNSHMETRDSTIPEPSTALLLGLGMLGAGLIRRKRRS